MKTVRDACVLQPNALKIQLSDQIEQLDELIKSEGDGTAFFDKTFVTEGMRDLIDVGLARLAGHSGEAYSTSNRQWVAVKLTCLSALGCLRQTRVCEPGSAPERPLPTRSAQQKLRHFNGRNNPDHFFWGEIAQQLDRADVFNKYWTNARKLPTKRHGWSYSMATSPS